MIDTNLTEPTDVRGDRESIAVTSGRRRLKLRRMTPALMFLLPVTVVLVVFRVIPFIYAIFYSLTDWNGIDDFEFIGFDNYVHLVTDPVVLESIKNTLILIISLPLWVLVPMAISIAIHEGLWLGRAMRLALLVPIILSPAIIGLYYTLLLQPAGPVNDFVSSVFGLDFQHNWLSDPKTVLYTFVAIALWASIGTGTLFYSAGLATLDDELSEAAMLDGASRLQRIWYVSVPHLRTITTFWILLTLINYFTAMFPLLFTLTGGGPGHATTTVDMYVYQLAFNYSNPALSSALGLVVLGVVAIFASLQMRLVRRGDDDAGSKDE